MISHNIHIPRIRAQPLETSKLPYLHPVSILLPPAPDWKANNTASHDKHYSTISPICSASAATKDLEKTFSWINPFHTCPSKSIWLKLSRLFVSLLYLAIYRKCMECSGTRSQAFILKFTLCAGMSSWLYVLRKPETVVLLTLLMLLLCYSGINDDNTKRCYFQVHHVNVQYETA